MHSIKDIRTNLNIYKDKLKARNAIIDFDNLVKLDEINRSLIQKKELLEKKKKDISKKKDKSLFEESKKISVDIDKLSKEQQKTKIEIENIISSIPNLPLNDVPVGKDEKSNKEISKSGKINDFNFSVKSHFDIGNNLGMLDFDLASKTTGSRFVFVKDKLAMLERAISNFMIDTHTKKKWIY